MTVQQWFNNGCNYNEGVAIYATLKDCKPNLLRLFYKKETAYNLQKLKYELGKNKNATAVNITNVPEKIIVKPSIQTHDALYKYTRISDYPVELHPIFKEKNNNFYEMCSLKMQLNALPSDEAFNDKALELCLKIDALDEAIIKAWKILDHYTATKNIINTAVSFNDLTPEKKVVTRNYKRANLSKAKAKLKKLKLEIAPTNTISKQKSIARNIEKTTTKILQLENEIQELNLLIEGKK